MATLQEMAEQSTINHERALANFREVVEAAEAVARDTPEAFAEAYNRDTYALFLRMERAAMGYQECAVRMRKLIAAQLMTANDQKERQ
jgi:hypothetical protein